MHKFVFGCKLFRCLDNYGKCKKGFPQPLCDETYIDPRGYVQMKRSKKEDENTVEYNPELLLFWSGPTVFFILLSL